MFRERKRKKKRKRKRKRKRLDQRSKGKKMEITGQQQRDNNGTDPSKLIYGAVKGCVFDVTTGKSCYGPGGLYAMFVGKDASRALVKMSKNDEDISPSLDGLNEKEIGVLNDWENNQVHWTSKSFVFSVKFVIFCSSVMEDQLNQLLPLQYMQRLAHAFAIPEAEVEEEFFKRKTQQREEWFDVDEKLLFVPYTTLLGEYTYKVDGEGSCGLIPLRKCRKRGIAPGFCELSCFNFGCVQGQFGKAPST